MHCERQVSKIFQHIKKLYNKNTSIKNVLGKAQLTDQYALRHYSAPMTMSRLIFFYYFKLKPLHTKLNKTVFSQSYLSIFFSRYFTLRL